MALVRVDLAFYLIDEAPDCDLSQCLLPDCFCSPDGTRVPGNIDPAQVPQMIAITFNGAVNSDFMTTTVKLLYS